MAISRWAHFSDRDDQPGEDPAADRDVNLKAAEHLVGRTIKSADVNDENYSLTLELDDGSRIYVDALLFTRLEIRHLSSQEVFEIDRSIMEEEFVDMAYERLRSEGEIPQLHDDRHEWTELPSVSGGEPATPKITHATRVELEGGLLRIYRTDDGRRHLDPDDVKRIFGVAHVSEIGEEEIGNAISIALTERERSAPDSD